MAPGPQLVSMSRRSMQLEGKLRETSDREAQIRAQMQTRLSAQQSPSSAWSSPPSPLLPRPLPALFNQPERREG